MSPDRILAVNVPSRSVVRDTAPRLIFLIRTTPGHLYSHQPDLLYAVLRSAVPFYATWRPSVSFPVLGVQLQPCTQQGLPPCYCWWRVRPYHCTQQRDMVRDTAPCRMIVEVGNVGVGGAGPSRTVAVAPSATTIPTFEHGSVPSHFLVGAGHPAVLSLE